MGLPHAILVLPQAAAQEPAASPLAELIVLCIPLVLIVIVFIWFLRRIRAHYRPLHDRSMEHMERLEAKTDEMIHLLRDIRERLDRGRGQ